MRKGRYGTAGQQSVLKTWLRGFDPCGKRVSFFFLGCVWYICFLRELFCKKYSLGTQVQLLRAILEVSFLFLFYLLTEKLCLEPREIIEIIEKEIRENLEESLIKI